MTERIIPNARCLFRRSWSASSDY